MNELNSEENNPQKKPEVILTESQQLTVLEMLNENPEKPPKIKDILLKVFEEKLMPAKWKG